MNASSESLKMAARALPLREMDQVQRLVQASYAMRHADAARARRYAALAVQLAEGGAPAVLPEEFDLRALAWAHLGNALRIVNDIRGGEAAVLRARGLLRRGSADPGLAGLVSSFLGSVYESARRFPDAEEALRLAIGAYGRAGDSAAGARCLIQLANVVGHGGNPCGAVALLNETLLLLERTAAPDLLEAALHNLAWFLVDAGMADTAQRVILEEEAELPRHPQPLNALRRRWLLARIAAGLGGHDVAAAELARVRDEFVERDQPYDAALVALELALEHAGEGDTGRARAVLLGVVSIFSVLGIGREATAALLLEQALRSAALQEVVPQIIAALRREPVAPRQPGSLRVADAVRVDRPAALPVRDSRR